MPNDFTDLDLSKLDFGLGETPAAEAPVTPPVPEAPVTPEPSKPAEPGVATPPVEPPQPAEPSKPAESTAEGDDLVQKILDELKIVEEGTQDKIEEAKKEAQATGNEELVTQLSELQDSLNKEMLLRQKVEKEKEALSGEYGRVLDERNLFELENKQKQRLYGIIDNDEILQAIVAYTYKAQEDPTYKQKLIDSAKELLKREGIDVDAANVKAVQAEKQAMGGANNASATPGVAKPGEGTVSLENMFEQI